MAKRKAEVNFAVEGLLLEKASHSPCTYKISAIAFDAKGDILGHVTNSHSQFNVLDGGGGGRAGTARHAERILLARYKNLVKTIVICRTGRSGAIRPIDPCPTCRKVAAKYGARIISLLPGDFDIIGTSRPKGGNR